MRRLMLGFTMAVAATALLAAVPASTPDARATETAAAATQPLRVQPWHLLRHDGAELYRELCASCHGVAGEGNGPAAEALPMGAPALSYLRQAGVPREHWAYVVMSGCDDRHHRAADGSVTMPCWQRIFRQALGNDAAPLMVKARLMDHLDSIQH